MYYLSTDLFALLPEGMGAEDAEALNKYMVISHLSSIKFLKFQNGKT